MTAPLRRFGTLFCTVAVLVGAVGCSSPVRNPFARGEGGGEGSIRVRVENQHFLDASVYVFRGGDRSRLGNVTGKSEGNFTLRWPVSTTLEFEIGLVGGATCFIRSMSGDPGDRIWVRIPPEVTSNNCYAGKS